MDFAHQRASSPTYGCNFIIFQVIHASRWADRIGSHVSEFVICYTWIFSGIHMKLSKLRCCRSAMVTVPVMAVALGSASVLNAQAVRTAAQFCSGTSAVKPPTTTRQGYVGSPGSFLPGGSYIMVVCAIDSSGKYSAPSSRITAATPLDYSSLGYSISTPSLFWSSNTAGYELFLGTAWASGYESYIQPDANALVSYLGPKLVGSSMPTLPTSITVSSIPTEILPSAIQGRSYLQSVLVPDNGVIYKTPPFTWSLAGGNLPQGMSFDSTGLYRGA